MHPVIALVARPIRPGRIRGWPKVEAAGVPRTYIEALRRAGAREAILYPEGPVPEETLEQADGLLLIGGGDVDPDRYGGEPHDATYGVHEGRDELEIGLAHRALARGLPLLAICRGMQVVNVALGGTLEPHLPDNDGLIEHGSRHDHVLHDVRLEPGTRVAAAMGTEVAACASTHHQAVQTLGDGLVPTGWSEDGLIEAVEHGDGWLIAVQWHPERTAAEDPAQQGLFDELVRRSAQG